MAVSFAPSFCSLSHRCLQGRTMPAYKNSGLALIVYKDIAANLLLTVIIFCDILLVLSKYTNTKKERKGVPWKTLLSC